MTSSIVMSWVLVIVVGAFSAAALYKLWGMNWSGLISEPAGPDGGSKASLSRFQFLIFTFVIAGLYLVLSLKDGVMIPIDPSVLGLIGISGGSFVISKGISSGVSRPASPPSTGATSSSAPPSG